jgi:putative DNA primase/helicase
VALGQRTGDNAMSNNPETWSTFDESLTYFRTHSNNGVRGLGFRLGDRMTAFVGADLDHCLDRETGRIDPWAQKIVSKLSSYTEVTPSGEGLRIFIIGRLPA